MMAHTFATQPAVSHAPGIATRFAEIFAHAKIDYANWRLYRKTVAELHALGARELDDLGMNQADIKRIALESVYGKRA
jgi:uncharacterized protein YjiS (DUF1127 family)